MIENQKITPRKYQQDIYDSCKSNNTLVVLPTGLGKTLIALMLAQERLTQYPNSKILFLAPTKPLAQQHLEYFTKHMVQYSGKMTLYTGKIKAATRKVIWDQNTVIFSTPQCIQNDLKNRAYDLSAVTLVIFDECHRCLKNYSYTGVAQEYLKQAINQRILGLTASPGVEKDVIRQIMTNLNISKIELRTRTSPDVEPYLQDLSFKKVMVDLPFRFDTVKNLFKGIFDAKVVELRNMGLMLGPVMKRQILDEQKKISGMIKKDSTASHLYWAASLCSQLIRLDYCIELLSCQSLHTLNDFVQETFNLANERKSRAVQVLVKIPEFIRASEIIKDMIQKDEEHPKMNKIKEIILSQQIDNPNFKAIVFSQFRTTTGAIAACLNRAGIPSAQFVGQKKTSTTFGDAGSNQKEQKQIIDDFKQGKIKVLAATSIGEEGLDIPEVNAVIFYEPVPSAIRKIQRAGRTARLMKGSLYILVAAGTRDEAYYYSSIKKEEKMHRSLNTISNDLNNKSQSLDNWQEV
jgi:Fanconi anemia group M protein